MKTPGSTSYTDFQSLGELRARAAKDPTKVVDKAAQQFEAVFIEMMLKSMREAGAGEGAMDSDQSKLYRDLFDKQVALSLSENRGIGLAKTMVAQLKQQAGGKAVEGTKGERVFLVPERGLDTFRSVESTASRRAVSGARSATAGVATAAKHGSSDQGGEAQRFESPDDFIKAVWPHAEQAARRLGTDPKVLVAQAALETGWGGSVISEGRTGRSSHNLFNIKADSRWDGDRVTKGTLEYRDGVAVRERAAFRAYDSYAESFNDYVDFLQNNPRYRSALKNAADPKAFIEGLHKAGYATDPAYASKVKRILGGETLTTAMADLKTEPTRTIA